MFSFVNFRKDTTSMLHCMFQYDVSVKVTLCSTPAKQTLWFGVFRIKQEPLSQNDCSQAIACFLQCSVNPAESKGISLMSQKVSYNEQVAGKLWQGA